MINTILIVFSILIGALVTLAITPFSKDYLKASNIVGIDQQKIDRPEIVTSGGIVVLFGFLTAVTLYIGLNSLFNVYGIRIDYILAALCSVLIITLIGFIDDLKVDRSNSIMKREGLGQIIKMLSVLPAALPLIAIGAGSWTMNIPLIGQVYWGYIYPLFWLPIGMLFVSNVVNMLAGMNGLAASLSAITSLFLGMFAWSNGYIEASVISFSLFGCLIVFLGYNWYPASFLPGDSLTYLSGAVMFSAIVLGNMEKFGILVFSIWIIEFFLKARGRFNVHSWGHLKEDGSLHSQYDKIYSLTHILMKRGYNERQITLILSGAQFLVCLTAFALLI